MGKITFHCGKGGKVTMKAEGIPGATCKTKTKAYLDNLLGGITSDQPTSEMHQAIQEGQQEQERA
jgi:hypothetical protein